MQRLTQTQYAIIGEISRALESLGAPPKLLGAVNSWGDTLEDEAVLDLLQTWNNTGDIKLERTSEH